MSRRAVIFILWLFLPFRCLAQVDSTRMAELDKRLEKYFQILEPESVEVKSRECDLLIDSAKDSILRQHIALKAYGHYLNSTLMGDEGVAVHLTDTWFAPGLVSMGGDEVLLNARIFADFNRQSLLGEPAPSFVMESFEGDSVVFGGPADRYRILLFYDTDCAKCKLETMLLRPLLDSRNWPVDLYAVYTGGDKESWRQWLSDRMDINAPRMRIFNLWDPEAASDYQMKYGVLQTPKMFLVDRDGIITGRGLDSAALERLLDIALHGFADYEYGSAASAALMDKLFASYDDTVLSQSLPKRPDPARILSMAETIESRTLAKGDTASFKHLEGDLLYWLTSRRDETCKEGTVPFINDYVLSRPGIWNTPDDTLRVVGLARMMKDLLSRTPVGSKLPKAKELRPLDVSSGDTAAEVFSDRSWNGIRRKGGRIVFHSAGCPVCRAELSAADSLGFRTLEVNVDEIMDSDPGLGKILLDTFDLSSMPFILEVGRHGVIRRRYVSFLSAR